MTATSPAPPPAPTHAASPRRNPSPTPNRTSEPEADRSPTRSAARARTGARAHAGTGDRPRRRRARDAARSRPPTSSPPTGLVTYAGAEEGGGENGRLDPGLEVQVLEQQGDWAKILCSNGWSAWVDARQLQAR